ncbi:MAG: histidine kinase [Pseudonocardia sp.]|nr:histidine kinase [Pseudonocardia sp.]
MAANRRRRFLAWTISALAAVELAVLGGWVATGATVLAVLVQLLLATALAAAILADRYLEIRRRQWVEYLHTERRRERARIAEDLHDLIGHQLSLVALRAGAIQVHTSGLIAETAAELRTEVERAVLQLRETVLLLDRDRGEAATAPAESDIGAMVARARNAGADVVLRGGLGPDIPAAVRLTAHRVVQECLTNAAKHAPGSPVEVLVAAGSDRADLTVRAGTDEASAAGDGTGLRGLRRRVEAIGGRLEAGPDGQRHVVHVELPLREDLTDPEAAVPARRPRPLRATLRRYAVPLAVTSLLVVGFHQWATQGATLEGAEFEQIVPGQSRVELQDLLPSREAPIRLTSVAPEPPASRCRYYTDGNFPLGLASYEVCHDDTTVTRVTDLRRTPLW